MNSGEECSPNTSKQDSPGVTVRRSPERRRGLYCVTSALHKRAAEERRVEETGVILSDGTHLSVRMHTGASRTCIKSDSRT